MRHLSLLALASVLPFSLIACSGGDSFDGGTGGAPSGTGGSVAGIGGTTNGTGSTTGTGSTGSGASGNPDDFVPLGATCQTFGAQSLDDAFAAGYAAWKTSQVESCNGGARVKGCPAADASGTCSEAQAYGMLLAVAADDRTTFDQLNSYRLQMLQQSSTADKSLMPWAIWNSKSCPPVAEGGDKNAATDADLDAAMALLQAQQRWGGDTYRAQADTTLAGLLAYTVAGSGASIHLKPGNQDGDARDYVAYYTPAYFAVFAEATGNATWTALTDAYYTRLNASQCAANGQIYDDFAYPGECKFWWDSCRVPWRVALDYSWHQDARAKDFLDTLESFVGSDPTAISDQKNSAFTGAAVLSALSNDDPGRMQELCTAWANPSTTLDDSPYFQKTLRLLYLSVAGGKFVRPL
ncbi:MAG TPA: glycosyl hydrolase family 8 [Polyangiaceae bacterium]|nr:glycosyl hydrolase family 8 [Polyangiaceae bacterium]